MGGTLVYAPVCDVLHRMSATPLGTRPFGDDPTSCPGLVAAMVGGSAGSRRRGHPQALPRPRSRRRRLALAMPIVDHDVAELREAELPPFRAGIAAGALRSCRATSRVPALTGGELRPATVSPEILRTPCGVNWIRRRDHQRRARHGWGQLWRRPWRNRRCGRRSRDGSPAHAPRRRDRGGRVSGAPPGDRSRRAGRRAARRGGAARNPSAAQHLATRSSRRSRWSVASEHRRLAREIADASVTLVRDPEGVLPLRPGGGRGSRSWRRPRST